jgi:hypothetical protein
LTWEEAKAFGTVHDRYRLLDRDFASLKNSGGNVS